MSMRSNSSRVATCRLQAVRLRVRRGLAGLARSGLAGRRGGRRLLGGALRLARRRGGLARGRRRRLLERGALGQGDRGVLFLHGGGLGRWRGGRAGGGWVPRGGPGGGPP